MWKDLKWSWRLLRKHNLHHTWRKRKHLIRPTNKPTWNSFSSLSGNCSLPTNQLPTANYLPVLMVILQYNLCKLSGMSLSVVFTSLCHFYFPWSMSELVATRICASWIAVPEIPDKPFSYLQRCDQATQDGWLYSCPLSIPYSTSTCFICILLTWLTFPHTCPQNQTTDYSNL